MDKLNLTLKKHNVLTSKRELQPKLPSSIACSNSKTYFPYMFYLNSYYFLKHYNFTHIEQSYISLIYKWWNSLHILKNDSWNSMLHELASFVGLDKSWINYCTEIAFSLELFKALRGHFFPCMIVFILEYLHKNCTQNSVRRHMTYQVSMCHKTRKTKNKIL